MVDHLAEYKDIPEYHTTGWYDSWSTQVANLNYVELRRTKKSLQRLIIGPWIHSNENRSYAGEAQFTENAALDLSAFQLRWFEHWLKGIELGHNDLCLGNPYFARLMAHPEAIPSLATWKR